jgi:hypothetical protein
MLGVYPRTTSGLRASDSTGIVSISQACLTARVEIENTMYTRGRKRTERGLMFLDWYSSAYAEVSHCSTSLPRTFPEHVFVDRISDVIDLAEKPVEQPIGMFLVG